MDHGPDDTAKKARSSVARTVVLLLSLVLILITAYLGSYGAIVVPQGRISRYTADFEYIGPAEFYKLKPDWCSRVYWPLEQLDRLAWPGRWYVPPPPVQTPVIPEIG